MTEYESRILRLAALADETENTRLARSARRAAAVLGALDAREHDPGDVAASLHEYDRVLSATPEARTLARITTMILRRLEQEHQLVPPGHYRNQWMALGMAAFGLPLGVAFANVVDNMAFIGIGLPVGIAIGMSIGADKDAKAARDGRQLAMPEE